MKKLTNLLIILLMILIVGCTPIDNENDIVIEGLELSQTLLLGDEFAPLENLIAKKNGEVAPGELNWFGDVPLDEKNRLTEIGTYTYNIMYLENGSILFEKEVTLKVIDENELYDLKPTKSTALEFKNIDKLESGDGYKIVWSDEFDTNGTPNTEYWDYNIGNGDWGWGNGEKQYYTNRQDNVTVKDGKLIITAKRENYQGYQYTSTRIVSRKKVDIKYGRIEFMAKLPKGKGTWPALWMMPTDSVYGTWPRSGEIDVMEHVGNNEGYVLGTCHSNVHNGTTDGGMGKTVYREGVTDEFHLYSVEWTPDKITFLFDDEPYYTYQNPKYSQNNNNYYPYDQEFYIIMNIAMGGTLGGDIDSNFTSAQMEIEYVRVYQKDYTNSDTEKPKKVEVTTKQTANTIELNWTKSVDNIGLKHYEIFVNGKSVDATIKTKYTLKNLNPDTEYDIQIVTVDLAGNYSISSLKKVKTTSTKTINNQINLLKNEEKFAF